MTPANAVHSGTAIDDLSVGSRDRHHGRHNGSGTEKKKREACHFVIPEWLPMTTVGAPT
jgi:hypothetical protein